MKTYIGLITCLLLAFSLNAQDWLKATDFPEELGNVHWLRSYDEAISKAKSEGKPVFILFQEVPGCSTCKNYGNNLLTHPHIVEALETFYIPLAIYNNKGGEDAAILKQFGEPAWNNPVARIIDPHTEKDITKRLNGRYDMSSLIGLISFGILDSGNLLPEYLHLLSKYSSSRDLRETHLSMYCFWSGEKKLGTLNGVVATKAGYMNGTEVVKVKYDANRISEEDLISFASEKKCADAIYTDDQREVKAANKFKITSKGTGKFKSDNQPKYYIYNTDYKYLPMTSLQALKVNSALSIGESPDRFLSPRQIQFLKLIKAKKNKGPHVIDQDFALTWNKFLL